MVGENSARSSHIHNKVQGMEVLRASLLTQETTLRALADSTNRRFQAFERRFDEIIDWPDALAICANMGRNDDRQWLRDDYA